VEAEYVYIEATKNLDSPGIGSRDVPDTSNPGRARAALSSSLTGAIDVASGNVTIQGKTDAGALVVINGRQSRASATGAFSASFPLAGTATIAVVGKSRPGFSMLLNLPAISSVARHVLPVMTFSYDGTSGTLGLAGKVIRKPPGAVKGYVTDAETRGSISFAVGKDDRFSTTLRLGTGLNTLHSSVRYLLLMRYTLPGFTVTVGPVPRTIISLQVGSPRMTVGGVVKTIDAQGDQAPHQQWYNDGPHPCHCRIAWRKCRLGHSYSSLRHPARLTDGHHLGERDDGNREWQQYNDECGTRHHWWPYHDPPAFRGREPGLSGGLGSAH
jgi:hypothetical protein